MTIPELAKELNITPQAIYVRLKREGIPLNNIKKSPNSDQLTSDGIAEIEKMFNKHCSTEQEKTQENQENNTKQQNQQNDSTLIQLLQKQIESLEKDKEFLQKQNEALSQLLAIFGTTERQKQLPLEAQTKEPQPAPAEDQQQPRKKHWWSWRR